MLLRRENGNGSLPTFAGIHSDEAESDIDREAEIDASLEPSSKIKRLNSANYQRGLTILVDSKPDEYVVSSDNFVGFKVRQAFLKV